MIITFKYISKSILCHVMDIFYTFHNESHFRKKKNRNKTKKCI